MIFLFCVTIIIFCEGKVPGERGNYSCVDFKKLSFVIFQQTSILS